MTSAVAEVFFAAQETPGLGPGSAIKNSPAGKWGRSLSLSLSLSIPSSLFRLSVNIHVFGRLMVIARFGLRMALRKRFQMRAVSDVRYGDVLGPPVH